MDLDYVFSEMIGSFAGLLIIMGTLMTAWAIVATIATWKLFNKAGQSGWKSIVPIYNCWVLVEIAGLEWWWFLLIIANSIISTLDLEILTPVANIVSYFALFNCYYNIAKKFNKDTGYAVCTGLFSMVFVMILGFSKKEIYDKNIPVSKYGVFGTINKDTTKDMDSTRTQEVMFCGNCGTKLNQNDNFCPNCGKEKL